jgi:hypothetical protein
VAESDAIGINLGFDPVYKDIAEKPGIVATNRPNASPRLTAGNLPSRIV